MNFTREPIIETIITPKDGHKLVVRGSKNASQEEYVVDAIEVVSFGRSLFFRSLERPKSFLVPVSDFEVIETKETRVVLKNASFERSIKIGGGKGAKKKEAAETADTEAQPERKRERRQRRRKRAIPAAEGEEKPEEASTPQAEQQEKAAPKGGDTKDEAPVSSKMLIPPPTALISDTLAKEGKFPPSEAERDAPADPVVEEEKPKRTRRRKKAAPKAETEQPVEDTPPEVEPPKAAPSEPEGEAGEVQRTSLEAQETASTTSFSTLSAPPDFFGKLW